MSWTQIKNLGFLPALLLGLSQEAIFVLAAFIAFDILTGVIKSIRIKGWHSITSQSLTFGILFKLLIVTIPLLLAWTGQGVGIDMIIIAEGALKVLVLSEAYSILGNIHSIGTGKEQKEFDAVNWSIKKFRGMLLKLLK